MRLNIFARQPTTPESLIPDLTPMAALAPAPMALQSILVPVDFSPVSRRALEYAVGLAARFQAEIVLLHVFQSVPGELKILESTFVDTSFREQAQADCKAWHSDLLSLGIAGRALFCEGTSVDRAIVASARNAKSNLIVMGHHQRHGPDRLFSHYTVSKVLAHAPCPVLVAV